MSSPSASSKVASINVVPAQQRENAVATLLLAFATDPMARWSMPDPRVYLTHFPALIRAFAGNAFEAATAHATDGFSAAALWLAPGSHPDDEALIGTLEKVMPASRFAEGGAVFEQMASFHPQEPHWYLPLIGVDPAQQGKGLGSALMLHALAECDATGTPAYLESSNPTNIPFYQKHGFVVMGEIQSGSSPTMYPMLRPAA